MFPYKKYNIKNTDRFKPDDFPKVLDELVDIHHRIADVSAIQKEDIIVSFLKDHSFSNDLLRANPVLTELFTSGSFVTTHLESLFDSCRANSHFLQDYEDYIRKNISGESGQHSTLRFH